MINESTILINAIYDWSEEFVLKFGCEDESRFWSEVEMRSMLFSQLALEWSCRNGVFCAWILTKDPSFRNIKDLEGVLEPKTQRLKEKLMKAQYEYLAGLAGEI